MPPTKSRPADAPKVARGSAPKETRKELVRREVLQQACLLFARQGFDGTNLGHVADAVGLTRGAIYYYFKSKEALLEAILQEVAFSPLDEMERWKDTVAEATVSDRLRSFIRMRVRNVLRHQIELRIIDGTEASLPPALLERHTAAKRKILAEYRFIIREGMRSGEFREVDDRVAAFGLIGMVNWTSQWFKAGRGMSEGDVADQIAEQAVASVRLDARTVETLRTPEAVLTSIRHDLNRLSQLMANGQLPTPQLDEAGQVTNGPCRVTRR